MSGSIASILIISLIIASPSYSFQAQTPSAQDDQYERVVVGTTEVVLDVIVRDKKGHAVKDLKASDFTVSEDNVAQQVQSFRLVTREGGAATTSDTAGAETTSPAGTVSGQTRSAELMSATRFGAVALVFDRLSPDGRSRARQAALSYLGDGLRPDDFVGVFNIDLSLKAVQPFTNNERLVRQAIDRAAAHSPSTYASSTESITDQTKKEASLQSQVNVSGANLASTGESTGGSTGEMGATAAEAKFAEMTQDALEGFERIERAQQGYATTDGLLSIIHAMGRLPGRKALILFSEGVAIPTAVVAQFRNVISAANRANVSIYAVDAAGLRATSADAEAGRAMTALGQRRVSVAGSPRDGNGPMSRDLERNEDLLRSNPEGGLGQLAGETGGLLISNTNNPGARLRQVDEDLHAYYVLTYTPKNQDYDGRFRQIGVKVNRAGVEVQARKGYYALNTTYGSPVLSYEVPALAILGGHSQPNAFSIGASAFSFPTPSKPGLVPVLVEVPAGSINFVADREKRLYKTDFSVVALIKDESQRVVAKLSNQYLLSGSLDKLEAARRGNILFYRETELAPGRYTIAAVVYDATTRQSGTSTGSVVVPARDQTKLQLSSVIIIKQAERLAADQEKQNPFHFGEVLVYPNMGEPLRKSVSKNLAFFITLYSPRAAAPSALKMNLEIIQSGRTLAQASFDLPAPDETGRLQYASAIPIDKLKPGDYELRVTVKDAQSTATRSEHFTIKS